ncbi:hypothetical protein BCR39DRAFT_562644 [Naematelia encephala]|uniref:Uncharacterized protein n=1 Tax=Naematelia encephala TaxID=71784 RepID=A0A1Y2AG03_9TREE|nr:hypothetical protein BCR39DRAFT_562644 [Naematelia encephala]
MSSEHEHSTESEREHSTESDGSHGTESDVLHGTETVQSTSNLDHFSRLPPELIQMVTQQSVDDMAMSGWGVLKRAKWLASLRRTSKKTNYALLGPTSLGSEMWPIFTLPTTDDSASKARFAQCLRFVSNPNVTMENLTIPHGIGEVKYLQLELSSEQEDELVFDALARQKDRLKIRSVCVDLKSYTGAERPEVFESVIEFLNHLNSADEVCYSNTPIGFSDNLFSFMPTLASTTVICSSNDEMPSDGSEVRPLKFVEGWLNTHGLELPSFTLALPREYSNDSVKTIKGRMIEMAAQVCAHDNISLPEGTSLAEILQCTNDWTHF